MQHIHGHADFSDPSTETGILYRVPEPSERVCCLFMDNQQGKSAGTLLPLAMHNTDSGTEKPTSTLFLLGYCGV